MKNKLVIITIPFLLTGCISGFVNKEVVKKADDVEIYTYISRVDKLLDVYAIDKKTKAEIEIEIEKLKTNGSLDKSETAKLLAEKLDQINSQNYPLLFSIVVGLNSNPTGEKNREEFWAAINNLINQTYKTRQMELQNKTRQMELQNKTNGITKK